MQNAPSSPYQQPWAWGGRNQVDAARLLAVKPVDKHVPVTSSPQLSAQVAEREMLVETPLGPPGIGTVWVPATPVVLLDTNAEDSNGDPLWNDDDRRALLASLVVQGYELRFDSDGIYRLERSG